VGVQRPPLSTAASYTAGQAIRQLTHIPDRLGQLRHVVRVWLVTHFLQLVVEWVGDAAEDSDDLVLVVEGSRVDLNHLKFVHLFHQAVQLRDFLVLEGEGRTCTGRHLGVEAVDLGLTPPPRNYFQIGAFRLENASHSEEALDVLGVDHLFAAQDVDEVESLGQHGFALGVDDADDGVVRRFLQLGLLDNDSQFVAIASVDLLECLDHQLV